MILFIALFQIISTSLSQEPSDPKEALRNNNIKETSLLSELENIYGSLSELKLELAQLEVQKQELLEKQNQQRNEIRKLTIQYQQKETQLLTRMKTLYLIHRRGLARVIFGADSPVELRRRSTYLMSLIDSDKEQLMSFKDIARQRKSSVESLSENQKKLDSLKYSLGQKGRILEQQKEQKLDFLKTIREEKQLAMKLLREVNQSQTRLQRQIDTSPRKSNFSAMYGKLPWPVQGKLVRRYGKQIDSITGKPVQSLGIDIQAPLGTPVSAVASGVITLAQFIPAYGHTVAVSHGSYSTIYAHLNGILVQQGQSVQAGSTVGQVGNTGLTNRDNQTILTFEIRYNKTPQNPLPWLRSL